jgi:hypothetical protein
MRSPAAEAAATNMVDNGIANGNQNVSDETRTAEINNILNNGIDNTIRQIENTNATILAIRGVMNAFGENDGNANAVVPNANADVPNANADVPNTFQHGGILASGATKRKLRRTQKLRRNRKVRRNKKSMRRK